MKTISVREDLPWGRGDHPDAKEPLSAFRSITAVCNDCGHIKVLDEAALRILSAVTSFGHLAKHAYCSACREADATGKANIEFRTEKVSDRPLRPVEWSSKEVFTDDRSDPTPALPRRRLFGRPNANERMR